MVIKKQIRQQENVVPRRSNVCVFSLPLTPPKEMFASQNVEKTSTKTESELCTIEILCHESPHCKIHP